MTALEKLLKLGYTIPLTLPVDSDTTFNRKPLSGFGSKTY